MWSCVSAVGCVRFESRKTWVSTKADAFELHTQILLVAEREDVAGRRQLANANVACQRVVAANGQLDCSSLIPELDGPFGRIDRGVDESKQMRELVSRCPRGPRSGADVGREVLAGEGG